VKALALVLVLAISAPAVAQDAPVRCEPGDVILKPDVAVATAKRLAAAEAKVAVYESHPPLPAWGVVLLVLGGVAIGAASTAIVATVAKGK
jgi:hypothetical protein